MKKNYLLTLRRFLIGTIAIFAFSCNDSDPVVITGPEPEPEPEPNKTILSIKLEEAGESTENSITVKITPSENASGFKFAAGLREELEYFKAGLISNTVFATDNQTRTHTFDNLEPETEYFVFAEASDPDGNKSEIVTLAFQTAEQGELPPPPIDYPHVEYSIENLTGMYVDIKITPNEYCPVYLSGVFSKSAFETVVKEEYDGDIYEMMYTEYRYGLGPVANEGESVNTWELNGYCNYKSLLVIVLYDEERNEYSYITEEIIPQYNSSIGQPQMQVEVYNIGVRTATTRYTPGENTQGYYHIVMPRDSWDKFVEYDKNKLLNFFWVYWEYETTYEPYTRELANMTPGTEYLSAVIAWNDNGMDDMEMFYESFFLLPDPDAEPTAVKQASQPVPASFGRSLYVMSKYLSR